MPSKELKEKQLKLTANSKSCCTVTIRTATLGCTFRACVAGSICGCGAWPSTLLVGKLDDGKQRKCLWKVDKMIFFSNLIKKYSLTSISWGRWASLIVGQAGGCDGKNPEDCQTCPHPDRYWTRLCCIRHQFHLLSGFTLRWSGHDTGQYFTGDLHILLTAISTGVGKNHTFMHQV